MDFLVTANWGYCNCGEINAPRTNVDSKKEEIRRHKINSLHFFLSDNFSGNIPWDQEISSIFLLSCSW